MTEEERPSSLSLLTQTTGNGGDTISSLLPSYTLAVGLNDTLLECKRDLCLFSSLEGVANTEVFPVCFWEVAATPSEGELNSIGDLP
jgi:hypothetical protein